MKKMWKVICPIEKKDGTGTHWARLGVAYGNKDESINLYLDSLPMNGKLQLREWTEEELRERDQRRSSYQSRSSLADLPGASGSPGSSVSSALGGTQPIPF
ncbi:MAG: hypothetical protein JO257_06325 [Deltaproteobacteria bacterium]|nr:hypothetical protein [Deltaproteobacteria bacterium]